MKAFIVKVICTERHEYEYTVAAKNEKEAEENFLIEGEVCNNTLLTSRMGEVLSVKEA